MWWNILLNHTPLFYLTQSLWRDEAFSVLLALHSPVEISLLTAQDFTPPFYYLLLSVWMGVFGTSEIAVRSLSIVAYIILLRGCYVLAKEIQYKLPAYFPWLATLLVAINPMVVYYACEARAYMLAVCLGVWVTVWYLRKKWNWFTVMSVLMLYTHPYTVLLLFALGITTCLSRDRKEIFRLMKYAIIIALLYTPWLVAIYFQVLRSTSMWFYPVDMKLVLAVLSNMYTGFEGTPPGFWDASMYISAAIIAVICLGFPWHKVKRHTMTLLFLWLIMPLGIVIGISFYRPVFVARYVLFVTIAEVFLMTIGVLHIKYRYMQYMAMGLVCTATVWFTWWYAPYHAKADFRSTFDVVNVLYNPGDIIVSENALVFFESMYYAKDTGAVYVYHPTGDPLPPYVGAVLIPAERLLLSIPENRTIFLVHEDGTYTLYL